MDSEIILKKPSKKIVKNILKIFGAFVFLIGLVFLFVLVYYLLNPDYTEEDILKVIRTDISPSVVKVECFENDTNNNARTGTGLYFLTSENKEPYVETNAHVVLASDGKYHGCKVYFPNPDDGTFYESIYDTGIPLVYHDLKSTIKKEEILGIDYALLPLRKTSTPDSKGKVYPFPPEKKDAYDAISTMCRRSHYPDIVAGRKVYLLGYPSVGGDSLTLTDGIVSGFSDNKKEWIKVSAVANHGTSGGVAIGGSDGCDYGILSDATFTNGSNLGFVLRGSFIRDFIANASGTRIYPSIYIDKSHTAEDNLNAKYELDDISFKYPNAWKVSTTSEDRNGDYVVYFDSPFENAIDPFKDYISVSVYPDSDEKDFANKIADNDWIIKKADISNVKGRYINLKGIKAYENDNIIDDTKKVFSSYVEGYSLSFLYKGSIYTFTGLAESSKNNTYDYLDIFKVLTESIIFK
ncbi:MAG: serine protease [Candidatus Taylorbacteria bacterium]|nr:serine protease [Candidatus Taylorbacteria bacterium]